MANILARSNRKATPTPKRTSKRPSPTRTKKSPTKQAAQAETRKSARPKPVAKASTSKQSRLIELLRSPKGGTMAQMAALTGWQTHTVRGTISGVLRKRLGLTVQSAVNADSGERVYRIAPAA
jgi:hypothetical protein